MKDLKLALGVALGVALLVLVDILILLVYVIVEGLRGSLNAMLMENREDPSAEIGVSIVIITIIYAGVLTCI